MFLCGIILHFKTVQFNGRQAVLITSAQNGDARGFGYFILSLLAVYLLCWQWGVGEECAN